MNDFNQNMAWALCALQEKRNICTKAIESVLPFYSVSRSAFYRAKKRISKGETPGEGKSKLLTNEQWKNVKNRIMFQFEKGVKIKTVEVSGLVFSFFFFFFFFRCKKNTIKI
jgi:hypothetical protein